ncbi:MAG: YncE family protein [Chitinophagales bacterium]
MNHTFSRRDIMMLIAILMILECNNPHSETQPLQLLKEIQLPNVSGRIDHIAFNSEKQIAYVAALGNNSVEVVDLKNGTVLNSIKNLSEPQGIVFIPGSNSIFVANGGNGKGLVFDANNFQQTHSLVIGDDADNVRYDSATEKIFVGYGSGGIAMIDAKTFQLTGNIPLTGHPESFQLSKSENKIFVNVPDEHEVDVIDLKTSSVTERWHPQAGSNFPMAI